MKMGGLLGVKQRKVLLHHFLIIHYNGRISQNSNPYILLAKESLFDTLVFQSQQKYG